MITEEQAIEYAKKLKEFCVERKQCVGCPFDGKGYCTAAEDIPSGWIFDD